MEWVLLLALRLDGGLAAVPARYPTEQACMDAAVAAVAYYYPDGKWYGHLESTTPKAVCVPVPREPH